MDERRRAVILLVVFVVLLVGFLTFFPKETNKGGITSILNYSVLGNINLDQIAMDGGYNFEIESGKIVNIGDESGLSRVSVFVENANGGDDLRIISEAGEDSVLLPGEFGKIDFDSDGVYELNIYYSGDNRVSLSSLNEKVGVFSRIKNGLGSPVSSGSGFSYGYLFFSIFFILLVLLIVYIFKIYVSPSMWVKKVKARQSSLDTLEYLISEFKSNIKSGDKKKANANYSRIKHISSYLTHDEKIKMKNKLNEIEKVYIVSLAK